MEKTKKVRKSSNPPLTLKKKKEEELKYRKKNQKLKKKEEKRNKKILKKKIRELNKRRKAKSHLVESVQKSIPYLADYENGILELKKSSKDAFCYSMMLEFEDTNYQILSVEKGETLFGGYRDILNSFQPGCFYQISIVKSEADQKRIQERILRNNIVSGRKEVKKGKIDELRRERDSIIMNSISENKSDKRKKLYLTTSIMAHDQLEAMNNFERIESDLKKAFKKIESKVKRLDTLERLEVYHDIYRPSWIGEFNRENRINYKEFVYKNYSLKDYICPDGLSFKDSDKFQMGDRIYQCLLINNFPALLDDQMIGEISELNIDLILTISIRPYNTNDATTMLKRQITDMEKDKIEQQKKALKNGYDMDMINHDLKQSLDNAIKLLDAMRNNNQKLFDVSIMIMHNAKTEEELRQNFESLKNIVSKYLCHIAVLNHLQEPACNQIMPYGIMEIPELNMPMPSESLAGFIPFSSLELFEPDGIWYGVNAITKKLIKVDRLKLMNANGFILGTSGSGKSMAGKNEIIDVQVYAENEETIVIDPDGEYITFDQSGYFDSEVIEVSAGSYSYQNPMDMDKSYGIADEGDALKAKSEFLISVFSETIAGGNPLSGGQLGILDRCIREVYQKYIDEDYNPDFVPTFLDIQEKLEQYGKSDRQAYEMAKAFEPFSKGLLNYFSHKTNIDINNKKLIIYNIKNLGSALQNVGYLVMLDGIWNRVLKNMEKGIRTRVYADEFTVLLKNPYAKKVFWDMFKRFRKMGGAATGMTQNITALLRDPEAEEMLGNAEFLMLLKQKEVDRQKLGEIIGLSDEQLKFVTDTDPGAGILKVAGKVVPFELKYPKNTKSYQFMTSKPEDKIEMERLKG